MQGIRGLYRPPRVQWAAAVARTRIHFQRPLQRERVWRAQPGIRCAL